MSDGGNDSFGVLYMLIGQRHAPLLAVSIHSLRNHYSGPVAILAGDETAERYARLIAADSRAGDVRVIRWEFIGGQRGAVYAAKTRMWELSPFDRTVFLDADTVVVGDFSALCPTDNEIVLTRFADWRTTGRRMQGRIMQWKDVAPILVSRMVSHSFDAINTGCVGFSKSSGRFFAAWNELCARRISFICDELSCQLVYPDFPHRVLSDEYNFCAIHSKTPIESARVLHFHGGNAKLHNRPEYHRLWWPAFSLARDEGFAGLNDWAGECGAEIAAAMKAEQEREEQPA